jgi:predicted nucleic acid-binding Zn ribbon protein
MKPTRKKMAKPDLLGNVLEGVLKASNMKTDLSLHKLWRQWAELVGPTIADNARPAAIKGKLLLVNVSSAPWMQQLQFLKNELIEKLNTALGKNAVRDIRFQIGPVQNTESEEGQ